MKKKSDLLPLLGVVFLFSLASCQKTQTDPATTLGPLRSSPVHSTGNDSSAHPPVVLITDSSQLPPPVLPKAPLPQQPPAQQSSCPVLPLYGDTIIYPQPTNGSDYIITPINSPGAGKYLSWPVGMVIDSMSGAVDLTASETGLKYIIGFVKAGTNDTCLSYLTIGGASYADSVYTLNQGQNQAVPYFEGDPTDLNLCKNGNACRFDVTGSAANMHVIVDKHSGKIDLEKTLNGGLLGGAFGLLPINGQTITTDIYYEISDDPSNNALQHIAVQLVYYDSKQLINIGLLNNILTKLDNLTSGNEISTTSNPRPPLVVIVRHN